MRRFRIDLDAGLIQLLTADELTEAVLGLLEENVRRHIEDVTLPVLHAHDAYYLALAQWLRDSEGFRPILITLDRQPWVVARAFGIESFHANTCDLGRGVLSVGLPGRSFPAGANCSPCQLPGCPSEFRIDLQGLPEDLGSGRPRSGREIEDEARPAGWRPTAGRSRR
jgi:hypothetical protein